MLEKPKTIESPELTDDEAADIKEFYYNKNDRKIRSLDELLAELHGECFVKF